jgi:hypothetical protein
VVVEPPEVGTVCGFVWGGAVVALVVGAAAVVVVQYGSSGAMAQ